MVFIQNMDGDTRQKPNVLSKKVEADDHNDDHPKEELDPKFDEPFPPF